MRKICAILLTLIMVMGVSVTTFATESSSVTKKVSAYKTDTYGTENAALSMANDAMKGYATVTTISDGKVQIDIPVVPLYNTTVMGVFTADGYLTSVTLNNGTGSVEEQVSNGEGLPHYSSATLRIVMDEIPDDGVISVTKSDIYLYKVGTDDSYWYSHVTPSFDIVLY